MALNIVINPLEDVTFFNSVRRLLGGIEEDTITDDDILDTAFFDMAEIELLDLVPCLADEEFEFSPADLSKIKLAFTYLVASKLIPKAQANFEYEVKTIDVTWRKSPIKWADLQNNLLDTVESLLSGIDCYNGNNESLIFSIAPSKRAVHKR